MGFGDFATICQQTSFPMCPLLGPSPVTTGGTGMLSVCYARSIELGNTIIFEAATDFVHIVALIMTVVMILHVRSKFTAVGRKEITLFFYLFMALTGFSLVLDSGIVAANVGVYPYLVAIQNGLTSALCTCLMVNGFVGFQLYEDGTSQSVWTVRGSSLLMFLISATVSIFTFRGLAGMTPSNTAGIFVVLYAMNALCLFVYVVMQFVLVINTLQDRWPIGDLVFGVLFFVVGQVAVYVLGARTCNGTNHYLDSLFFATVGNLLAVMMVYKYWDSITVEDLEFSVGTKQGQWEVKDTSCTEEPRPTLSQDSSTEYASPPKSHRRYQESSTDYSSTRHPQAHQPRNSTRHSAR